MPYNVIFTYDGVISSNIEKNKFFIELQDLILFIIALQLCFTTPNDGDCASFTGLVFAPHLLI